MTMNYCFDHTGEMICEITWYKLLLMNCYWKSDALAEKKVANQQNEPNSQERERERGKTRKRKGEGQVDYVDDKNIDVVDVVDVRFCG